MTSSYPIFLWNANILSYLKNKNILNSKNKDRKKLTFKKYSKNNEMNSQKHAQEFTELPNEMLSLLKEFSEIIFGLCYSEHEKGWLKGLDQTLINICRCPNRKGDKDA